MLADFFVPLVTIAIAEIGDKTQFAMLGLASRHRHIISIFMGAMLASVIVDGSAIVIGKFFAGYIPRNVVLLITGVMFLFFGVYSFFSREENGKSVKTRASVFLAAFLLFFVSEFGDKSQVAALLFGAKYNLLLSFAGAVSGIAIVLSVMLVFGQQLRKRLSRSSLRVISSLLFVGVGIYTLAEAVGIFRIQG